MVLPPKGYFLLQVVLHSLQNIHGLFGKWTGNALLLSISAGVNQIPQYYSLEGFQTRIALCLGLNRTQ